MVWLCRELNINTNGNESLASFFTCQLWQTLCFQTEQDRFAMLLLLNITLSGDLFLSDVWLVSTFNISLTFFFPQLEAFNKKVKEGPPPQANWHTCQSPPDLLDWSEQLWPTLHFKSSRFWWSTGWITYLSIYLTPSFLPLFFERVVIGLRLLGAPADRENILLLHMRFSILTTKWLLNFSKDTIFFFFLKKRPPGILAKLSGFMWKKTECNFWEMII